MQLGKLELPQKDWPALVSELQKRLSGQLTLDLLDEKISRKVKYATDETMINLHMEGNKRTADRSRSEDSIEINLNDVNSSKHRSFGCEYVCHSIWNELGLPEKLKDSGFSERERSLAEAMVVGRLVNPGSELATWDWIRNISSIGEITEESLEKTALNPIYSIGDKLVKNKEDIESHLLKKEKKMYPGRSMLYLFDLTNFYFEGQALGNSIAKRGKSVETRSDCPLVSLGLIVDSNGFPIASKIFPGNISDPKSLRPVLEEMGLLDGVLQFNRPTLVMDRGIATSENLILLREYQFPYILITRGPRNAAYLEEFEKHENRPWNKTDLPSDRQTYRRTFIHFNPGLSFAH